MIGRRGAPLPTSATSPSRQRERAVLEERADGLADEQRVPAGPLVDLAGTVRVDGGAGDERRKARRLRLGQPVEIELLHARHGCPVGQCAGSRRGEDQEGVVAASAGRRVRPSPRSTGRAMEVVDDDARAARSVSSSRST